MKIDVHLLTARARERFGLGCCWRDRHIVIIIRVYGCLTYDYIIAMVFFPDANPDLIIDLDNDDGVAVPPITTKAEACENMSVLQEYVNFHGNGFVAADFHAANHVLDEFFELRLAAQLAPSMCEFFT